MLKIDTGVWWVEAELQLLLQVRLGWVMAARGTLGRWRDALSQNHCPHMSRRYWVASQCQAKWHGCPKPPVPMGAPGWGWGLRHSGCQAWGLSICPGICSQPGPHCGQYGAFRALCSPCPHQPPPLLSGLSPWEKGSAFPKVVALPVPMHPILIFPGKINSSNMSALKWRYNKLLPPSGTQGLQPPSH